MQARRILILGGTSDAVELATELAGAGYDIVTSLAGVTTMPKLPAGRLRVGGFGGEQGLLDYLVTEQIDVVADAAHPFAANISRNGFNAARRASIGYVRLERPAWVSQAGDQWQEASDVAKAASMVPQSSRIMLTIGRKEIAPFIERGDLSGVVRMIEKPACHLPERWHLILARPPYDLAGEISILENHRITVLVTKNAGGVQTQAKLAAARHLGLPVILISRPEKPASLTCASAQAVVEAIGLRN